jgi:hypothetical protein
LDLDSSTPAMFNQAAALATKAAMFTGGAGHIIPKFGEQDDIDELANALSDNLALAAGKKVKGGNQGITIQNPTNQNLLFPDRDMSMEMVCVHHKSTKEHRTKPGGLNTVELASKWALRNIERIR